MRRGIYTTEFWATQLTSLVLLLNATLGLGIQVDDTTAMTIVGGIQGAYNIGRALVKGLSGRGGVV